MRTRLTIAISFLMATAIGMNAADHSLGTWKRNVERSTYNPTPSNPITDYTLIREAVEGGVKITAKGMRKDGTPINTVLTVKYDGKFVPVTGVGGSFDSFAAKQLDDRTLTTESKKTGGKYHMKGKTVISPDGKTMTTTQKGTDAEGKPAAFAYVYDKQ